MGVDAAWSFLSVGLGLNGCEALTPRLHDATFWKSKTQTHAGRRIILIDVLAAQARQALRRIKRYVQGTESWVPRVRPCA